MLFDRFRRHFITLLGGAATWPLAAGAQQPDRMRRIGVLLNLAANDSIGQARVAAFVQGLQATGWSDGRNVRIDTRWAAADPGNYRKYAVELMALGPDCHPSQYHAGGGAVAGGESHCADCVRQRH
jgi:putative tryptophan/tyrosine transport system substrate-binding protein